MVGAGIVHGTGKGEEERSRTERRRRRSFGEGRLLTTDGYIMPLHCDP